MKITCTKYLRWFDIVMLVNKNIASARVEHPVFWKNAEVSAEGPECIIEGEGWEKLMSGKAIKQKVKYTDVSDHSVCKNYVMFGTYKC